MFTKILFIYYLISQLLGPNNTLSTAKKFLPPSLHFIALILDNFSFRNFLLQLCKEPIAIIHQIRSKICLGNIRNWEEVEQVTWLLLTTTPESILFSVDNSKSFTYLPIHIKVKGFIPNLGLSSGMYWTRTRSLYNIKLSSIYIYIFTISMYIFSRDYKERTFRIQVTFWWP